MLCHSKQKKIECIHRNLPYVLLRYARSILRMHVFILFIFLPTDTQTPRYCFTPAVLVHRDKTFTLSWNQTHAKGLVPRIFQYMFLDLGAGKVVHQPIQQLLLFISQSLSHIAILTTFIDNKPRLTVVQSFLGWFPKAEIVGKHL